MSNGVDTGLRLSARSGFAADPKRLLLSIGLIVATAAIVLATLFQIDTDAAWLAKNSAPGAGWDTNFAFNTAADGGWQPASNNAALPCGINGCMIWWDGQFSGTTQVWLRRTFVLDGPVTSAFIQGGVDDDATITVNGTVVYNVFDGFAGSFGPINIAPFLVPGNNLIAVFAQDNVGAPQNHQFTARLTINTATAVPAMPPSVIVLTGLLLLAFGMYRLRGRAA